jgi:hypothetical protein
MPSLTSGIRIYIHHPLGIVPHRPRSTTMESSDAVAQKVLEEVQFVEALLTDRIADHCDEGGEAPR